MALSLRPFHRDPRVLDLAAWLLMPIAAHIGFSSFGFNPTDDGFIMAMSRRLLDGQIPHRDFISIRPVGSALLHMPEVWLGGPITLWLGRFVAWCEFAMIAFCWVDLAAAITKEPLARADRFLRGAAGFILSSHVFPLMPWHTLDALALASLGAWFATRPGRLGTWPGFFLIGSSALCRQNFILLPVIAILCLGRLRSWRAWVAGFAPVLLYAAALVVFGALPDAVLQLTTRMDVVRWGALPYLKSLSMWGGFALGFALTLLHGSRPSGPGGKRFPARHVAGLIVMAATIAGAASTMTGADTRFIFQAAFLVFGVCVGQLAALAGSGAQAGGRPVLLVLAIATAWSASVSIGYCSPVLALAALFGAAFHAAAHPFRPAAGGGRHAPALRWVTMLLVAVLVGIWVPARLRQIYRDRPAAELDWPLGDVLPGGSLIYTGRNTYEFLEDLQRAVRAAGDMKVAVVPECAAFWIRARQPNPLPLDWLLHLEMSRPELLERVAASLREDREGRRLLVQKIAAIPIATGFQPLHSGNYMYPVVGYVRTYHRKVGETRWFDIYE